VHLLSLAFTGFILYTARPGTDLFSWHPTCMTVAFILLLLQAIVLFSPESSLIPATQRSEKIQLHWILHAFGVTSALFGFATVYLNKEIHERKHFVTWHAKFGLATLIGVLAAVVGGAMAKYSHASDLLKKLARPANMKLYHATGGMILFMLAMATVALACYSNWFKNRVGNTDAWLWRLCFWTPIVLAVCVARQVTQSYLPRILEKRESELDAKARRVQSKIDAKLSKKTPVSNGKARANGGDAKSKKNE